MPAWLLQASGARQDAAAYRTEATAISAAQLIVQEELLRIGQGRANVERIRLGAREPYYARINGQNEAMVLRLEVDAALAILHRLVRQDYHRRVMAAVPGARDKAEAARLLGPATLATMKENYLQRQTSARTIQP